MFYKEYTVKEENIDRNNHLNNIVYIQWMQDIAISHDQHLGCDENYYNSKKCYWVAKKHSIDYKKPAYLNDTITVKTKITNMKHCSSTRVYEFYNQQNTLIAKAETLWVFIDVKSGLPQGIFPELKELFLGE